MRRYASKILAVSLILTAACGAKGPASTPASPTKAAAVKKGLQIKLTTVYVDDQEKALKFYTDVLGFTKQADFSNGGYRWITVTSATDPGGGELQLALDNDPAGKAYQVAKFQQNQPAVMFYSDDIKADYERIKAHGGEFATPPTAVTGSTIATLKDTCGNLIQITQLTGY